MRIGLTYDLQADATDEQQAEFDPPATIDALRRALAASGHQVVLLGSAPDLLSAPQPLGEVELVFNIAEGSHGRCREAWVPTLLELYQVPYVGSGPLALTLGLDKVMSKRLAVAEGIMTPRWISVEHPRTLPAAIPLTFPVIVKPRFEGSGRGIDAGAVAHTREGLAERVGWLFERCKQPLVVEEFIAYGELTVCVIGNTPPLVSPAIQRPLDPATRLSWHVAKPMPSRGAPRGVPGPELNVVQDWVCPLVLDEALDAQVRRLALRMFNVIGCRDFARIDLRVDEAGRLYFLEVNPLPSFDPEGSLGLIAEHLGTTYTQLIGHVLDAALLRLGRSGTTGSRSRSFHVACARASWNTPDPH
jgi:D-alanine-D-alanine ligase